MTELIIKDPVRFWFLWEKLTMTEGYAAHMLGVDRQEFRKLYQEFCEEHISAHHARARQVLKSIKKEGTEEEVNQILEKWGFPREEIDFFMQNQQEDNIYKRLAETLLSRKEALEKHVAQIYDVLCHLEDRESRIALNQAWAAFGEVTALLRKTEVLLEKA